MERKGSKSLFTKIWKVRCYLYYVLKLKKPKNYILIRVLDVVSNGSI